VAAIEPLPDSNGADALIDAQHAKGKLTARERIELLFDEGSFEEAEHAADDQGILTGCGTIYGRRVFVIANDYTHVSGSVSAAHAAQIIQLLQRAISEAAPLVYLADSEGLRLEAGAALLTGYGENLRLRVEASRVIPQISVLMGPCIGGDAVAAGLSDFIFMMSETSSLFVTGPRITTRLTGEDISDEVLGGATLHAMISGDADAVFPSDIAALSQLRRFINFLSSSHRDLNPDDTGFYDTDRVEPSLGTLVPEDSTAPYDVKDLILKVVDDADFFELKAAFAKNIVIGFGRLRGQTIGIIANQPLVLGGVIDANAASKAAKFLRFCDRFNLPIVTFVDVPGFLPGLEQEEKGLAAQSANLAAAYVQATVPRITIILGHAYGAAFTLMGSKQLGADTVLAWPAARLGLMNESEAQLSLAEAQTHGLIDAVIDPHATRVQLIAALTSLRRSRTL